MSRRARAVLTTVGAGSWPAARPTRRPCRNTPPPGPALLGRAPEDSFTSTHRPCPPGSARTASALPADPQDRRRSCSAPTGPDRPGGRTITTTTRRTAGRRGCRPGPAGGQGQPARSRSDREPRSGLHPAVRAAQGRTRPSRGRLESGRTRHRPRRAAGQRTGSVIGMRSIEDHPTEAENRKMPGHGGGGINEILRKVPGMAHRTRSVGTTSDTNCYHHELTRPTSPATQPHWSRLLCGRIQSMTPRSPIQIPNNAP
jgi:hypothetical protein